MNAFLNTWSPSYASMMCRIRQRNIGQGGNRFLAALPQTGQAMWTGQILEQVVNISQGQIQSISQLFRWVFHPFISLPLSLIACSVKERFYEDISGEGNLLLEKLRLPQFLPTGLRPLTIRIFEFISEQMSNVARIALIISGTVFFYFGQISMALGTIFAVSYEYLVHDLGIIPMKVSLFMEKWMPAISMVGLLTVGSFTSQILAAGFLISMIPRLNLWMHQKISSLFKRVRLSSFANQKIGSLPSLGECDAPLVEKRNLNAQQVDAILKAKTGDFEINPAHLTKSHEPSIRLEENRQFNELMRLWDEIDWLPQAPRIFQRLIDDKLFILFLQGRFPEAKRFYFEPDSTLFYNEQRKAHCDQIKKWVEVLAQEKEQTFSQFVVHWTREQLQYYVDKLNRKKPIQGEQRFLKEALDTTAYLIPFLTKIRANRIDIEDALLKLAIEGGDYCSLGMKRVSTEVLEGFVARMRIQKEAQIDSLTAFECEVRLSLQRERYRIVQRIYQEMMSLLRKKELLQDTAEDIHVYELVTLGLKRGFYPLSGEELESFTTDQFIYREIGLIPILIKMMNQYKTETIPQVMREVGIDRQNLRRNRVLEYLRAWVNQNLSLNEGQRKDLLNGILANTEENLAESDNYPKWNGLMLTILGVIKPSEKYL